MNRKRVERITKTIVYAIATDIVVVYRMHNYWHLPFDEIFDEHFWPIVVFSLIACYIATCYLEYKEDEDKRKNKKWDKWKDDVDNNTNDGAEGCIDDNVDDTDNDES